jgi:hypothetical protein
MMSRVVERAARERMEREEAALVEFVRLSFREDAVTVRVEKPRWMPQRMYRWLMRTIVREVKV